MNYNFSLIKDIKEEGLRQIFVLIPLIWVIIKYFQNGYPDSSSFDSWFFNSDSIFYHSVSKDIISNKGKLIDWYFPAAPSLFPSLLLVYIINLFTENIYFNNIEGDFDDNRYSKDQDNTNLPTAIYEGLLLRLLLEKIKRIKIK